MELPAIKTWTIEFVIVQETEDFLYKDLKKYFYPFLTLSFEDTSLILSTF